MLMSRRSGILAFWILSRSDRPVSFCCYFGCRFGFRIESELLTNEWRQLGDELQPSCRLFFLLNLDCQY